VRFEDVSSERIEPPFRGDFQGRDHIGYVCTGKLYDDIRARAQTVGQRWRHYDNGHQLWEYFEFGDRRSSWKKTGWRRAFYTRPAYEDEQRLLAFGRPDTVIYTKLGRGGPVDALLEAAGHCDWTEPASIIELHHGRGRDELVHRALKDFRAEQLPFKSFKANAAFYYTVLLAFLLFESFKRDVTEDVIPVTAYATRIRRQAIDFAARIVHTSGQIILKVTAAVRDRLRIPDLWERTADPPPLIWTSLDNIPVQLDVPALTRAGPHRFVPNSSPAPKSHRGPSSPAPHRIRHSPFGLPGLHVPPLVPPLPPHRRESLNRVAIFPEIHSPGAG